MNRFNIILSLAACAIIVGCGKKNADKTDTSATLEQGKISRTNTNDSGTVTMHSEDGAISIQTGSETQLPENFPNDVHIYPNATILTAFTTPESTMLGFETEDAIKTVAEQYQAKMLENGWVEKSTLNMKEVIMAAFSKKERVATLIIAANDTSTQFSITLTSEAQ